MATYTIRDKETGRTLKIRGDSPPTAQEAEALFAANPAKKEGERSFLQETGRQIGLTGRALAGGVAQTAEIVTAPYREAVNLVSPGTIKYGLEESVDNMLTSAGVPEPENAQEEFAQGAGRFATGFLAGSGGSGAIDDAVLGLVNLSKRAKLSGSTVDDLRRVADTAYEVAENAGVVVRNQPFKQFYDDAASLLKDEAFNETLHPRVSAALKELKNAADAGQPLKLKDIEVLRRIVGIAGRSADKDELRVASILKDKLDDFTNSLTAADVASGDPKAAMAALTKAREAWQRFSKSTTIENAIEIAKVNAGANFTRAGFEHALRMQFKQIARDIVKKGPKGWNPKEVAAIKHIASGGKLGNAMRLLGKLAPTGVISGSVSIGGGMALGGPVGAAILAGTGIGAKTAATRITGRNVDNLKSLVVIDKPLPKGFEPPDWLRPWLYGTAAGTDTQGNN